MHTALAGKESIFIIQPKDSYGNDKYCHQSSESFIVYVFSALLERSGLDRAVHGTISEEDDCTYSVKYIPESSGYHVVPVIMAISQGIQSVETQFNVHWW